MSSALVGDVAYVVRIETLRSTPLIVNGSTRAKPTFDRPFSLRPRLIESSPANLLKETSYLSRVSSDGINPVGYEFNHASLETRGATVLMSRSVAYGR